MDLEAEDEAVTRRKGGFRGRRRGSKQKEGWIWRQEMGQLPEGRVDLEAGDGAVNGGKGGFGGRRRGSNRREGWIWMQEEGQ